MTEEPSTRPVAVVSAAAASPESNATAKATTSIPEEGHAFCTGETDKHIPAEPVNDLPTGLNKTTRRIGPAAAITAATAAASLEQEELEEEEAMTEEPSTRPAAAAKPEIERLLEKAKEADGDETAAMLLLRQNKKEKKKTRTTVAVGKKSNTSGVNSDHNVETSLETTKVTSRANKEALQEPASEKEEDVSKPLPVMEVAGCIKCHKEMETGKKTKKPHSDHCPRKRVAFKVFPTMAHAPSSMIPDPSKEEDGVCFQVATEVPQVARKEKKLRVRNKKKTEVSQANGEATETKSASGKGGGRKENGDIGLSLPSQNIDVENKSAQSENFKTANQTKVEYTCPKCDRKFTFSSSRAAPGAFGNHLKHCDPEKKQKKLQKSQNYQNSAEEEDFLGDETQVSLNEPLAEARAPIDLNELKAGSRVIVRCVNDIDWQATIRKRRSKKGKPGFMIHYKGKKTSREDWVPNAGVVGFQENVA